MYRFLRPLLFSIDPELVHQRTIGLLSRASGTPLALAALENRFAVRDPRLELERFGLRFRNPVGLAAGMDKDGVALAAWAALGFGFSEAGSVTAYAQEGNPRPRLYRLPQEHALINRMGFNNAGAGPLAARLTARARSGSHDSPVLVNVGKSRSAALSEAASDYRLALEAVWPIAQGAVLNVSSPNTPGLRSLQEPRALSRLLSLCDELQAQRPLPVLLKLAPDLANEQLLEIVQLARSHSIAGLVAVNTTTSRPGLSGRMTPEGGLSGRPLAPRALEVLRLLRRRSDLPLVSVGGIFDAADVIERLGAGASLVELYTGFVYGGPGTVRSILLGLLRHLDAQGLPDVESLIGTDC